MIEALRKKYLASFEDKSIRIKSALESSDIQVLSTLIHQLAGSSGSYGFSELSDQCLELEQMIIDGKSLTGEVKQAVDNLLTKMEQTSQLA